MHRRLCSLLAIYTYLSLCCLCNSISNTRDLVYSGNYALTDCNARGESAGIFQLLPQVWQALQLVLVDLEHGTSSRHGFRTFLKSNGNLPLVSKTLRAISDGKDLKTGRPMIECPNPDDMAPEKLATYKMACFGQPESPLAASALPYHGVVVLCPSFWTFKAFPSMDDCPAVSGRRGHKEFVEYGSGLIYNQFAVLVHELVHLYNPVDQEFELGEVYSAQECTNLNSRRSVRNANNWALYAAGELLP